ncbi:hypothetical protein AB0876_33420 [Mycobacterium sp. NPDC049093]
MTDENTDEPPIIRAQRRAVRAAYAQALQANPQLAWHVGNALAGPPPAPKHDDIDELLRIAQLPPLRAARRRAEWRLWRRSTVPGIIVGLAMFGLGTSLHRANMFPPTWLTAYAFVGLASAAAFTAFTLWRIWRAPSANRWVARELTKELPEALHDLWPGTRAPQGHSPIENIS